MTIEPSGLSMQDTTGLGAMPPCHILTAPVPQKIPHGLPALPPTLILLQGSHSQPFLVSGTPNKIIKPIDGRQVLDSPPSCRWRCAIITDGAEPVIGIVPS